MMKAKLLAYKWTWLFGVAFLGSLLWSATSCDGISSLFVLLFVVFFLGSIVASLVMGITQGSRVALYRVVLTVIFCLLLFPPKPALPNATFQIPRGHKSLGQR